VKEQSWRENSGPCPIDLQSRPCSEQRVRPETSGGLRSHFLPHICHAAAGLAACHAARPARADSRYCSACASSRLAARTSHSTPGSPRWKTVRKGSQDGAGVPQSCDRQRGPSAQPRTARLCGAAYRAVLPSEARGDTSPPAAGQTPALPRGITAPKRAVRRDSKPHRGVFASPPRGAQRK